jgi:hypothetical protein
MGVVMEASLPLRCHGVDASGEPFVTAQRQQSNEDVLRLIYGLGEHRHELAEEHAALAEEISRIDFKLNLVLELVTQLLQQHIQLPPSLPVRLGSGHIEWQSRQAPEPSTVLDLELYLDVRYPRPVWLRARVLGTRQVEGVSWIQAEFQDMDEIVQDWLEKLIFRYHRRAIAHARHHDQ